MKWLSVPFKIDKHAMNLNYDNHPRLLYHQKHSQPAMIDAKQYMEELLSTKQIEPNESLGKAINYMFKRWDKFTQF